MAKNPSTSSRKSPHSKPAQDMTYRQALVANLRAELLNKRGSIDRAKLASLATKLEGKAKSQTVAQAAEFLRIAFELLATFDDRTVMLTLNEYREAVGPYQPSLLVSQVEPDATEYETEKEAQGAARKPGRVSGAKGTAKARG